MLRVATGQHYHHTVLTDCASPSKRSCNIICAQIFAPNATQGFIASVLPVTLSREPVLWQHNQKALKNTASAPVCGRRYLLMGRYHGSSNSVVSYLKSPCSSLETLASSTLQRLQLFTYQSVRSCRFLTHPVRSMTLI